MERTTFELTAKLRATIADAAAEAVKAHKPLLNVAETAELLCTSEQRH